MTYVLPVSIVLGSALARFGQGNARETFAADLQGLLSDLVRDLEIPAKVKVSVEVSTEQVFADAAVARIAIDGNDCRLPAAQTRAADMSASDLVPIVATSIHRQCELLVTQQIAERLQAEFAVTAPRLGALPAAVFRQTLVMLATHGFRTGRVKDLAPDMTGSAPARRVDHLFERAIQPPSTTRVAIAFGSPAESGENPPVDEMFALMQDGLFYELGLRVPRVVWEIDRTLRDNEFRLRLNDVRQPPVRGLKAGEYLINATPERLKELGIHDARPAANPANGNPCAVVRDVDDAVKRCEDANLTTWTARGYAVLASSADIRRHAAWLVSLDVVDFDLQSLARAFPSLIAAARERFDVVSLTQIIRQLLAEQISVRNLRGILESLLAVAGTTRATLQDKIVFPLSTEHVFPSPKTISTLTVDDHVEAVRISLKRQISHQYTRGKATLQVYLMEPAAEARLASTGKPPFSVEERAALTAAVHAAIGGDTPSSSPPVILTTVESRRALKRELAVEFPDLVVLSYQELSPDMNIQPLARIDYTPSRDAAAPPPQSPADTV